VLVRVPVSPVGDVRLPIAEEDALEHRRNRRRLRQGLALVRDRADGGAAACHGHVDRRAVHRDVAPAAGAADRGHVVGELRFSRARLAHRAPSGIDGDRVGRAAVTDRRRLDLAVDLEVEGAGIGARDESLDHSDRGLAARRPPAGRFGLPRQVPRDRVLRERGLDGVAVQTWLEGGRLAPAPRIGGEVVLALERRDIGAVRVGVAEVGDEPAPRGLDALEDRRDRVGRRRSDRLAVVLPDRLVLGRPVPTRERLGVAAAVHVEVGRDDVVLMVQVAARKVAVVLDRGCLQDVVAGAARGVADRDLLLVRARPPVRADRHGRKRGEHADQGGAERQAGTPSAAPAWGRRDHDADPSNGSGEAPSLEPGREAVRTSLARMLPIPAAG